MANDVIKTALPGKVLANSVCADKPGTPILRQFVVRATEPVNAVVGSSWYIWILRADGVDLSPAQFADDLVLRLIWRISNYGLHLRPFGEQRIIATDVLVQVVER